MTTLIEQIRSDLMDARKARDAQKLKFLTTLLDAASRDGFNDGKRDSTDAEVTKVLKKFISNTEEILGLLATGASTDRALAEYELAQLNAYLPKQASEHDVRTAVAEFVAELGARDPKQMGVVMGKLNAKFGANFDKALASKLVKEALVAA